MSTQDESFEAIDDNALENVAGGASSSNSEVSSALTAIQSSIKDLAGSKNNQGMDPMMMVMMMMMVGGGGGGGGGVIAAPAVGAPPVINVSTGVSGGGGCVMPCARRGKKGW